MSGFAVYDFSSSDLPRSYQQCAELYDSKRSSWTGRLANNTYLEILGPWLDRKPQAYAVRLHNTDVVTFYKNGLVKLDSGGWQTATTRDRMRRCGFRVFTEGGVAAYYAGNGADPVTFCDGMMVRPNGGVDYPTDTVDPNPNAVLKRRRRALRKGKATLCEGRQSSRWFRGNVPEAFEAHS